MELSSVWRYVSAHCICGCHLFSVMGKIESLCFQTALVVMHYQNLCTSIFILFYYYYFFLQFIVMWEIHKMLKYSTSVFVMPYFKILTGIFRILICYYYLYFL
jgi:hypothetical protein